jgi:predicted  nucleic acid-binding Zn-ribbon protein
MSSVPRIFVPFIPTDIPIDVQLYETRHYLMQIVEIHNGFLAFYEQEVVKFNQVIEKSKLELSKLHSEYNRVKNEYERSRIEGERLSVEHEKSRIENEKLKTENGRTKDDYEKLKTENGRTKDDYEKLKTEYEKSKSGNEKFVDELKIEKEKIKNEIMKIQEKLNELKKLSEQPYDSVILDPKEIIEYRAIRIYEERYQFKKDKIVSDFGNYIQLKKKKYMSYDMFSFSEATDYDLILEESFNKKSHYMIIHQKNGIFHGTEFTFLTQFGCAKMIKLLWNDQFSILSFFK